MTLINSNFDFLNKPWWGLDYDDRDVHYFLSDTKRLQRAISSVVKSENELFRKGYIDLHRERYLIECISAESNIELTVKHVQQLLKGSWFRTFLDYFCRIFCGRHSHYSHLAKKVQNLHNAICKTFPSIFFLNLSIDNFTPLLAQQLHQQIGNGLIENAGQYRTQYVMAAQENYIYLAPDLIKDKMNKVFHQCQEKFRREDLQLEDAIKFGACFLTHFLYIHPFKNGNGRVARLLLSYLLSKFTVVPLSLYTGAKTRDVYLQCLRESRYRDPFTPNALATFILENIHLTSYNICAVMDIYVQNDTSME
ncbi:126_t:CDS:1 [Entrophospora sp. SA101]|nr:126_t:CDS:1 [Entrophospora sp. SA101]